MNKIMDRGIMKSIIVHFSLKRWAFMVALLAVLILSYYIPLYRAGASGIRFAPVTFVFLINNGTGQILLMTTALIIFCDAGTRKQGVIEVVGELVYLLSGSLIFLLIMLTLSVFLLLPVVDWTLGWGEAWMKSIVGPRTQWNLYFSIPRLTVMHSNPFEALLQTFLLEWGCLSFLAMAICATNFVFHCPYGVLIAMFFILWDTTIYNIMPSTFYLSSPLTLAQTEAYKSGTLIVNETYGFMFFSVSIILMSLLCIVQGFLRALLASKRQKRKGVAKL